MRSLVVVSVVLALSVAATAGAAPAKQCAPLPHYIVTAHGVSCSFARKWVRRYVKAKKHPSGWSCTTPQSGTNVKVNCQGPTKPKGDSAYRYYYGIAK